MIAISIAGVVILLFIIFISMKTHLGKMRSMYTDPFNEVHAVKQKLKEQNPQYLDNLSQLDQVLLLLKYKSESFMNSFYKLISPENEQKEDFYEELIEPINKYILYTLVHLDLTDNKTTKTTNKDLKKEHRKFCRRIEEVETRLKKIVIKKKKSRLFLLHKSLIMYIEDLRKLDPHLTN